MKLGDLINALADEIEIIRPELDQHINELSTLDASDPKFSDAAEFYSEQVERMGEAADMVGFPGLQQVCTHVNENIALLVNKDVSERDNFIDFLQRWPDFVVHYLKNIEDPSCATALVEFLRTAPQPLAEDNALDIVQQLGSFSGQMNVGDDDTPQRPVLVAPNDVNLTVPNDVDPNLLEGFYQEAPGQTEHLVTLLTNMLSQEGDISDIVAAKRIVHTLKGTGAIIGLSGVANFGHHFEDILDYFEAKEGEFNPKIATVLLDGAHVLAQMIAFLTGNDEYPTQARETLQNILDIANIIDKDGDLDNIYLRSDSGDAADQQPVVTQATVPAGGAGKSGAALRVSMSRIEELFRVSAEVSVQSAAMEAQIKTLSDATNRLRSQQLRVKKRLFELETIVDVRSLAMMQSNKERAAAGESFDPLELEQYNELHSTTHALLEEFNDIFLLSDQLSQNLSGLNTLESRHQILARDLQHLVIGTRMSEVGSLEPRLQRNIRTTCQMTGKQARLELTGGETLIDSDVLSQLAEPLLHILRNAVDHGIEDPEERMAKGKDPVGTISLDFTAQGQQIFMRCQDDGKGLDYDRILARALENNLVAETDNLTEEEIGLLIFNSGFSTRDSVSQVSGRGVGMDVVRNWLNTMNGDINVSSEANNGTTMTLSFASSLTTVQSLIVESAEQAFALPSVQVQQALSHDEGHFVDTAGTLKYHHGETVYAAMHLSDILGFEHKGSIEEAFAVLMVIQGETWALAVDNLIDSRELLLQPPGIYLRHISGIIGTSILGDGSIAIHLDMPQLIARSEGRNYQARDGSNSSANSSLNSEAADILVVDDSLSVRNTLQELLEDAGFSVKTARDGIEAVNILEDITPHLVLTDLEMPNMNGVELTSHIRNRQDLKNLPVVMITSRSQDKHKEMAVEAGVDTYLTKPYNDSEVLQVISQSLGAVS